MTTHGYQLGPNTVIFNGGGLRITPLDAEGRPSGEPVEFGQPPVVPGTVNVTPADRKALPANKNVDEG